MSKCAFFVGVSQGNGCNCAAWRVGARHGQGCWSWPCQTLRRQVQPERSEICLSPAPLAGSGGCRLAALTLCCLQPAARACAARRFLGLLRLARPARAAHYAVQNPLHCRGAHGEDEGGDTATQQVLQPQDLSSCCRSFRGGGVGSGRGVARAPLPPLVVQPALQLS